MFYIFFFEQKAGIGYHCVTGFQTCALPICTHACGPARLLDGLEAASRHWPEDSLRVEHFVSTVGALDPAREQGFEVELRASGRSEEHTSELQSHSDLVCRLLLEKKKHSAA